MRLVSFVYWYKLCCGSLSDLDLVGSGTFQVRKCIPRLVSGCNQNHTVGTLFTPKNSKIDQILNISYYLLSIVHWKAFNT
jgi:hypothetical protein